MSEEKKPDGLIPVPGDPSPPGEPTVPGEHADDTEKQPAPAPPAAVNGAVGGGPDQKGKTGEKDVKTPPGFLELVYGVLFEPVPAFSRVVKHLPVGQTVLIFTLVNLLLAVAGGLLAPRFLPPFAPAPGHVMVMMKTMTLVFALVGVVFQFMKWFVYSALLHLLAEFFGGRGRAAGVWVVAGLASLPEIFLVPVNLLLLILGVKGFTLSLVMYLFGLIVLIWGMALLILGIRAEHALSTGRAVAVVLLPAGAVLFVGVILIVVITAAAASFAPFLPLLRG